jgi:hypothetical protein
MTGVISGENGSGDTVFFPTKRRLINSNGDTAITWVGAVNITANEASTWKSSVANKDLSIGTALNPWNVATVNANGLIVALTANGQFQVTGSSGVELIYLGTVANPVDAIYYNGVAGVDIANWTTKGGLTGTGVVEKRVSDLSPGDKVLCIPA